MQDVRQRARVRGPEGRRPARPFLWRHGRDRRGRQGEKPHRASDLSRRLRAQGRPEPVRPRRAEGREQHARTAQRRTATAGSCRSIRCRPTPRPADLAWAGPRRRPQPIKTFEQKIKLTSPSRRRRATTSTPRRTAPGDVFRQFGERAKSEAGWKYYEIDASHNPHITCPDVLMTLLTEIMAGK